MVLTVHGCTFPDGLWYDAEHQVWARPEADGTVCVGITSMGLRAAGEIYMCRPRAAGSAVQRGRSVAVVELAKSIVSVKSPVSGIVAQVNPALATMPERVHLDPYGAGWLALLQPEDWAGESAGLLHGEAVAPAMRHYAWLNQLEAG